MSSRYLTALKGVLDFRTPGYLIFFVTPRCNCHCKMCFYAKTIESAAQRNPLTLDEVEKFARNFPGLHQVNFSGGEPFLREDFAQIPSLFYQHSGTRFFTCPTNSSLPEQTEAAVRTICETCPDAWVRITQSLDGVGEVHDAIRERPGLFEDVLDLNARLDALSRKYSNLSVGIATVITKYNREHVDELLEYVYAHLKFVDYGTLFVRGDTREREARDVEGERYRLFQQKCMHQRRGRAATAGLTGRLFTAINQTAADFIMRTVLDDQYLLPCLAGRRMVVMDDEGSVEPCEVLKVFVRDRRMPLDTSYFGNIRDYDYDIRKLLATDRARTIVKAIRQHKCHCTFECAWSVNVLYSPRVWPRVVGNLLRLRG